MAKKMDGIKILILTHDLADSKARNYKDFTLHINLDFFNCSAMFWGTYNGSQRKWKKGKINFLLDLLKSKLSHQKYFIDSTGKADTITNNQ